MHVTLKSDGRSQVMSPVAQHGPHRVHCPHYSAIGLQEKKYMYMWRAHTRSGVEYTCSPAALIIIIMIIGPPLRAGARQCPVRPEPDTSGKFDGAPSPAAVARRGAARNGHGPAAGPAPRAARSEVGVLDRAGVFSTDT